MKKEELDAYLNSRDAPVILLEGRRSMPEDIQQSASTLGTWLAENYPHARFRSGNATGSDEAFSSGVIAHDPKRLEIFAPTKSHRKKERHPEVKYISPTDLTTDEEEVLAEHTNIATPKNERIINMREKNPRFKSKANYLIRDTLKVVGADRLGYQKPALALFFVDLEDEMAGGTGHTIRVCQNHKVPYLTQRDWLNWLT